MSSKPILYMKEESPPSRAVMMVIDLLGLDVEYRTLNPVLREQDAPEFVKINPMRTIPFYVEGKFSLSDSHAIIIYLMEKYSKPEHSALYPSDHTKQALILQRLFFDCGVLFPRLRAVMAPTYAGRISEMSKNMIINIEDAYGILEMYLSETTYFVGEDMTIADLSILSTVATLNGLNPVDGKRYPKLKSWLEKMNKKDVCIRINKQGCDNQVAGLKAVMENTKYNLNSKL